MKKYIVALTLSLLLTSTSLISAADEAKPNIKVLWMLDSMTYPIPEEKTDLGFFVKGNATGKIQPAILRVSLTNKEIFKFVRDKEKEGMTFFYVFVLKDDKNKRRAVLASKEEYGVVYGKEVDLFMANYLINNNQKR